MVNNSLLHYCLVVIILWPVTPAAAKTHRTKPFFSLIPLKMANSNSLNSNHVFLTCALRKLGAYFAKTLTG